MKTVLYFILMLTLTTISCEKFKNKNGLTLNDHSLYLEMSKGTGIWHLTSLNETTTTSNGNVTNTSPTLGNDVYWLFYEAISELVASQTLETKTLFVYQGDETNIVQLGSYRIIESPMEALTVEFAAYTNYIYTTTSFEKNTVKFNRTYSQGGLTISRDYILERCKKCEIPYPISQINTGG